MSPVKISSPPPRFLLISSEACNNLHLRHRQSRHSWHSWHRRDKLILFCLGEPVLTQNTTCDTCFRFCVDMRPPWIWISLWKAGSPHLELEKQPANATMAWLHDFNTTHQILSFCNQETISTGRAPPRWSAEARTSCQRKHKERSQGSSVTWNSKYLVPELPSKEISIWDRPFPALCAQSGFQRPVVTTQHLQLTLQPGAATDYHPSLQKRKDGILLRCPKTTAMSETLNPRSTRGWPEDGFFQTIKFLKPLLAIMQSPNP